MEESAFNLVLHKYLNSLASVEERDIVESWYREILQNPTEIPIDSESLLKQAEQKLLLNLQDYIRQSEQNKLKFKLHKVTKGWWWAAAVVWLILLCAGLYFWQGNRLSVHRVVHAFTAADAPASGEVTAILTLADGTKTSLLDSGESVSLPSQGGAVLNESAAQLTYIRPSDSISVSAVHNTLETPSGKLFEINLSDSSKVWLNARSSLSYPTIFTGAQRVVTLKGEGYFEITKKEAQPFLVVVNNVTVKVSGANLNIYGYGNEPVVKTTLLKGDAQLFKGDELKLIQQGQQAVIQNNSNNIAVNKIAPEDEISWKNGFLHFDHVDVLTMMRQVARWYNIEVQYPHPIPAHYITGNFAKSQPLSTILNYLVKAGLKITEQGRIIKIE